MISKLTDNLQTAGLASLVCLLGKGSVFFCFFLQDA